MWILFSTYLQLGPLCVHKLQSAREPTTLGFFRAGGGMERMPALYHSQKFNIMNSARKECFPTFLSLGRKESFGSNGWQGTEQSRPLSLPRNSSIPLQREEKKKKVFSRYSISWISFLGLPLLDGTPGSTQSSKKELAIVIRSTSGVCKMRKGGKTEGIKR